LLSRLAAKDVTVFLGGDGGDELFAGYRTHSLHRLMGWADRIPGAVGLLQQSGLIRNQAHWLTPSSASAPLFRHLGSVSYFSQPEIERWLPGAASGSALEAEWVRCGTPQLDSDLLATILKLDFRYYLGDAVLQKVDRASMAHGLEVRAPLLDRRLVAYGLGLAPRHKFDLLRGKAPLRRVLTTLVPKALWNQKKQGFSVPLDRWFRGTLLDELRGSLKNLEFWGMNNSQSFIPEAQTAKESRVPHRLWSLFVLAKLAQRYA
jgi:asparagine synthase (glutamine-hydrolysing)